MMVIMLQFVITFCCAYVFPSFLCECRLLQKITLNKHDFKNAFPGLSVLSKEPRCPGPVPPSQLNSFKTHPHLRFVVWLCQTALLDSSARPGGLQVLLPGHRTRLCF